MYKFTPGGSSRPCRLLWLCLAWSCVGLGAIGALLPLVPTTPFVLLAAWAAPKGSPRLAGWLRNHATFGPSLRAWQQEKAVATKAKLAACVMMAASWFILCGSGTAGLVLAVIGALFICVGGFLVSRPAPTR